jgi:uncharacterized membrane protein YjfL (UPF0719 family)
MDDFQFVKQMGLVIAFGAIGILLFVLSIAVMGRLTKFSIEKEIVEDQNTALGIVMGSFLIGVAIIVAAAIKG